MARWTIRFDASVTVNVEANTVEEAMIATAKTLVAVGLYDIPAELLDCAIIRNLMINEDEQAKETCADKQQ